MSDTLAATEAYLETRYRERSAGERVEMACGMFSAAVQLARAGICMSEPGLSELELRIRLIKRFYGDEFPPEFLAAVAARLESAVKVP